MTAGRDRAGAADAVPGRGWPRAAGLFAVVLIAAAAAGVQPSVLLAVPFLLMVGVGGVRRLPVVIASILAMILVVSGARDGIWYAERAWALLVGGCFVGLTLAMPARGHSARSLGAVLISTCAAGLLLGVRRESWATLDFAVTDRVREAVAGALEVLMLLRGGEALPATMAANFYRTAEARAEVFPAMLCLAAMAGLGVAVWLYARLSGEGDQALGPVRNFRFNDHLVWLMIGGLLLVLFRRDEALARIGTNAVVFMGALYTLRGAAVVLFVTGGLSVLSYVLLSVGVLVAAPLAIGFVMMVGLGDTWLDVRSRPQKVAT